MGNKIKLLLGFLIMPIVFSCTNLGNNNTGKSSVLLDVTPGTISEVNPAIVAAAQYSESVDSENSKFLVLFYVNGKNDYSDRSIYMWPDDAYGYNATDVMKTVEQNGYKFGYFEIYDGTTLAAGLNNDVADALSSKTDVNIIVKIPGSAWTWQTPDIKMPISSGYKHFLIISDSTAKKEANIYGLSKIIEPTITSAIADSRNEIHVSLSVKYRLSESGSSNFVLSDSDGNEFTIIDTKNYEYKDSSDKTHNYTDKVYIKTSATLDTSKTYFVKHSSFKPDSGIKVDLSLLSKEIAGDFEYKENDLGVTLNGSSASFKTWVPVASDVKLILFKSSSSLSDPDKVENMTKQENGIWAISNVDVSSYKYYKFRITNFGKENDVCDIYAKSASPDSVASQITDINSDPNAIPTGYKNDISYGSKESYYNPFGNSGKETKHYMDAVIYEMHIRDWSRLAVTDSTGKFLDIANSSKIINHIKDLGVTHVQILPMFDYAQKVDDDSYNWGYNPYHYNVPEGRYVTKGYSDGTQAVREMREMIAAFHDAGIAVNMDVVYNHTSGTGSGSLYDMTVPYYYYRLNADGSYSNGSGCGNETDSSAPMFKKYMIDSLKHWMLNYHINGFRFDLMGLHETETMKEIYKELSAIDSNVMVYGEPWNGGTSPVKNPAGKANINECADTTYSENGVACFNDDYRNAIKGSEYPEFASGLVSEYSKANQQMIVKGLLSKCFSAELGRSINYVECHDNLTVADKLALLMNGKKSAEKGNWIGVSSDTEKSDIIKFGKINELKKRDELCAAFVFLAPGTAFINGGQEFLRSKNGDENSYISDDDTNEIKQSYIDEYSDVTAYYKALISLRKKYSSSFGSCENPEVLSLDNGVVMYKGGDFVVYFNTTSKNYSISEENQTSGYAVSFTSDGKFEISSETTKFVSVPSLTALIIKK